VTGTEEYNIMRSFRTCTFH